MDFVARYRIMSGRVGKGIPALVLLFLLLAPPGCHWGGHGATLPPPVRERLAGDNDAPAAAEEWFPPAVAAEDGEAGSEASTPDNAAIGATEAAAPATVPGPEETAGSDTSARQDNAARSEPSPSAGTVDTTSRTEAEGTAVARAQKPAAALRPVPTALLKSVRGASTPEWAKGPEELVYRVDFIGITMGYARFRYEGKVTIAGKPAYHLNVRAWTAGVLSFIYPVNETIDYYLDTESLAPIRQEFTQHEKGKDDIAFYNQETGRITYRYRQTGKIRKEVDTIPSVYDPVSVAYYFRWKDLGAENRPRNMYGGRKVYQISSRVLGYERIRTERGEVDTIAVLPVIRRDGKPDNKGDLKVWFSNDERRVPVRVYAKFHKIKDWTLVGELVPGASKAGG